MCNKINATINKTKHLFYFILLQVWLHVQKNKIKKINAGTISKALAGLLQHALVLFYFMARKTKSAIKQNNETPPLCKRGL